MARMSDGYARKQVTPVREEVLEEPSIHYVRIWCYVAWKVEVEAKSNDCANNIIRWSPQGEEGVRSAPNDWVPVFHPYNAEYAPMRFPSWHCQHIPLLFQFLIIYVLYKSQNGVEGNLEYLCVRCRQIEKARMVVCNDGGCRCHSRSIHIRVVGWVLPRRVQGYSCSNKNRAFIPYISYSLYPIWYSFSTRSGCQRRRINSSK